MSVMVCNKCGSEMVDETCPKCNNIKNSPKDLKNTAVFKADYFSNLISTLNKTGENDATYDHSDGKYISNKKPKGSFKGIYIKFALIFLLLLGIVLLVSFKDKLTYSSKGKRTIMIYMIGSDLESKYYAASRDIDEITKASIDYSDVNILIYTGGTKDWHNDSIPNDKQALFTIKDGNLDKIEEFSSNNMLDYKNLSYLLNYGYENYDTEYYDLILWDHGAGPIYGYGYDEYHNTDSMSLLDIKKALTESPFNGTNKLELVGFDACLMSSIEIASVLSDYSTYMVASQEFEPGTGWDYSFLEKIDSNTSSIELGNYIVNGYYNYYSKIPYINGVSLSFIKLSQVERVEKELNELFKAIDSDISIDFSLISRTRSNSKSFGKVNDNTYYYDLVDLYDLIGKLPKKYNDYVEKLKSALSDLIITTATDLNDTNGISMYFPFENKKELEDNIGKYKELSFADNYYSFINNFYNKLTEQKEPTWDLSQSNIESIKDGVVSITLSDEVLNNYSKISYIVFERYQDNYFMPIFNGNDIRINGNVASTSVTNKALIAKDSSGNQMYLTTIQTVKGKNFVKYYVPGTLSKMNKDTLDFEMVAVYLEFVIDENNPNGYVASILPIDINDNYTYSEIKYDLNEWDSLTLNNYRYTIFNENGEYISDWQGSSIVNSIEFSKGEDINISITNLDVTHDFYCLFRIYDNQGNVYLSPLVEIKNQ